MTSTGDTGLPQLHAVDEEFDLYGDLDLSNIAGDKVDSTAKMDDAHDGGAHNDATGPRKRVRAEPSKPAVPTMAGASASSGGTEDSFALKRCDAMGGKDIKRLLINQRLQKIEAALRAICQEIVEMRIDLAGGY